MRDKDIAKKLYREHASEKKGEYPEHLTREYKIFVHKKTKATELYEKLAHLSGKIVKFPVAPARKKKVDEIFRNFDYILTAEDAFSFAILSAIFFVFLGISFVFFSIMLSIAMFTFAIFAYVFFYNYPKMVDESRRSKASTELVLCILYIIIYMKNVSNLEAAVRFAAENLEGPLATDLKKLLWDVSTKKYTSLQEALDEYLLYWKGFNDSFIDAFYMIETSLVQKTDEKRIQLLDYSLKRVLDGTFENMVHYVNDLRMPVSAVFMLGITLPIMGLVMLPLIGAFLGELITATSLFVFYDLLLPLIVIIMIISILKNRPSPFPQIEVEDHPLVPPKNHFYFLGKPIHAAIPAISIFFIVSIPFFWYIPAIDIAMPNETDVFFSLLPILGAGIGISVFAKLASGIRVMVRSEIRSVENDFGYAVFQISNRLSEGVPAEIAMIKTAEVMSGSNVAGFIRIIAGNMMKLGMDLKTAIFDRKYGAILFYPSSLIRSVMRIFIQSAKESEQIAATSMMHIAQYLNSVHNIEEKIKDVMAETISTLKFQTAFIAPLIAGIIVGLTSMIMIILSVLGEKIAAIEAIAATDAAPGLGGAMSLGFFEMSTTIPLGIFQLIVGIYLLQIVIISTILGSKIENGDDRIAELNAISKTLLISIIVYFVITLSITIAFGGMARIAIAIGEF